ncbi:SIMPL domain-containing protein [Candidatus Poribacteria bacterium]
MTIFRYILLIFCLTLVITLVACERDHMTIGSVVEGIQVTGTGSAFGDPDVAVLDLGIRAEEKSIEEAHGMASFAMQQVLDSLKNNGIAESDIQTRQFSIRPVYNFQNNQRVLQGYEVSNIVAAKVRDIDNTGKIIDEAVTAGSKWITVNSIGFAIDDPEALVEQARVEAMKNAKAKAQTLAELGEVTLGKPVSISEVADGSPIYYDAGSVPAREGDATPIQPGELEITVTVVVVYDIE